MKIRIAGLLLTVALVAHADDFKALDGKEYKGVTVNRVEPDGIEVTTDSGVDRVLFTNLPPDVQKRYGYDPAKAYQYQKAIYNAHAQKKAQEKAAEDAQNIAAFTGAEIGRDYDKNEVAADAKYKNFRFQVFGKITDFGTDILGNPFVIVDDAVHCNFSKDDAAAIATWKKGDEIFTTGGCAGKGFLVIMNNCNATSPAGAPPVCIPASELPQQEQQ